MEERGALAGGVGVVCSAFCGFPVRTCLSDFSALVLGVGERDASDWAAITPTGLASQETEVMVVGELGLSLASSETLSVSSSSSKCSPDSSSSNTVGRAARQTRPYHSSWPRCSSHLAGVVIVRRQRMASRPESCSSSAGRTTTGCGRVISLNFPVTEGGMRSVGENKSDR
ncbi:hypothetical protein VTK26DRAFT_3983 [Humicola hyalothermophila]